MGQQQPPRRTERPKLPRSCARAHEHRARPVRERRESHDLLAGASRQTMSEELEYWTTHQVAAYCGIRVKTIWQYTRRGDIPPPDLIWLRHPLWKPETIRKWRKNMILTAEKREHIGL